MVSRAFNGKKPSGIADQSGVGSGKTGLAAGSGEPHWRTQASLRTSQDKTPSWSVVEAIEEPLVCQPFFAGDCQPSPSNACQQTKSLAAWRAAQPSAHRGVAERASRFRCLAEACECPLEFFRGHAVRACAARNRRP